MEGWQFVNRNWSQNMELHTKSYKLQVDKCQDWIIIDNNYNYNISKLGQLLLLEKNCLVLISSLWTREIWPRKCFILVSRIQKKKKFHHPMISIEIKFIHIQKLLYQLTNTSMYCYKTNINCNTGRFSA